MLQFQKSVDAFLGYSAAWDDITYRYTEAIAQTLKRPQDLPEPQPATNTFLYEAPYDVVSSPDFSVKAYQFYVAVGSESHVIVTAFFTTRATKISQRFILQGTSSDFACNSES